MHSGVGKMSDYDRIIQDNCNRHSPVSWWPKYAWHYTDITNAVNILDSGFLYSRLDVTDLHLMNNDNASRQVINMTNANVESKVRFYFRPLTPTQYYNEGFKHRLLRYDNDEYANTPVPIFFLFDLEKILSIPGVEFSEKTQAGRGSDRLNGVDAFSTLNFDYIYSNDFENFETKRPYRHAEILHPGRLEISSYIDFILCRNATERMTLLNLLKKKNRHNFLKYKNLIRIWNDGIFYRNGLFISECLYNDGNISISFSDDHNKQRYVSNIRNRRNVEVIDPIKTTILLTWENSRGVVTQNRIETFVDYEHPKNIIINNVPNIPKSKELTIKVYFEDKIMCFLIWSLLDSEVLK